jgi:hypothetical protein
MVAPTSTTEAISPEAAQSASCGTRVPEEAFERSEDLSAASEMPPESPEHDEGGSADGSQPNWVGWWKSEETATFASDTERTTFSEECYWSNWGNAKRRRWKKIEASYWRPEGVLAPVGVGA